LRSKKGTVSPQKDLVYTKINKRGSEWRSGRVKSEEGQKGKQKEKKKELDHIQVC